MCVKLLSKRDLIESVGYLAQDGPLDVAIGDDVCLGENQWISIGTVTIYPSFDQDVTRSDDLEAAAHGGAFTWRLPTAARLSNDAEQIVRCDGLDKTKTGVARAKLVKSLGEGVQDVLRRSGLLIPVFDVRTMACLPLRSPITIVPDTTSVHQGALDFVCRFFSRWVRVKIPAVVHMEVVEQADNYLHKVRHADSMIGSSRGVGLAQHVHGCGGQATLLRLELHSEVEIDRGDLGADPLRGVITPSSDSEDKALKLTHVVRSFADRLILETARRFQSQVRRDHPLAVLTSDQGMARMCMAEGLDVWFFHARALPQWEGQLLTGTAYHPFDAAVCTVALDDALWEAAQSFGGVRVRNNRTGDHVELWAVGGGLNVPWQPVHAVDGLMPGRIFFVTVASTLMPDPSASKDSPGADITPGLVDEGQAPPQAQIELERSPETNGGDNAQRPGSYSFSPEKMLTLVDELTNGTRELARTDVPNILRLKTQDEANRYIGFLLSGGLAAEQRGMIGKVALTEDLWQALVGVDLGGLLALLRRVPSFEQLYVYINSVRRTPKDDPNLPVSKKAVGTYLRLGEAAGAWMVIPDCGIVSTPSQPSLEVFRDAAIRTYDELVGTTGAELVLSGQWIEQLALGFSIHPVVARSALNQARDARMLSVNVEGSTPDTRFEAHRLLVLESHGMKPMFQSVSLYQGRFLWPGTSSVRLKLQEITNAS